MQYLSLAYSGLLLIIANYAFNGYRARPKNMVALAVMAAALYCGVKIAMSAEVTLDIKVVLIWTVMCYIDTVAKLVFVKVLKKKIRISKESKLPTIDEAMSGLMLAIYERNFRQCRIASLISTAASCLILLK